MLTQLPHSRAVEALTADQQVVHLHFVSPAGFHWYAFGFDGRETFLGFANLADPRNAEFGYFTVSDLTIQQARVEIFDPPVPFPDINWRT